MGVSGERARRPEGEKRMKPGDNGTGDAELQWDRGCAALNQVVMGIPVAIGTYAIAKHRPRKLLYFIPGAAALLTLSRRFVCARCRYYGMECSTFLGVFTSMIWPRDESRPLDRKTMMADFALMGLLSLAPLPQVFKESRLTLLYVTSLFSAVSSILFNSCWRCGNRFCPMKDISRKISVQSVA